MTVARSLSSPLAGTIWTVAPGEEMTFTLMFFATAGDAGALIVRPGAVLKIKRQAGVRTEPASVPDHIEGWALLVYVVVKDERGLFYRVSTSNDGD